MQHTVNFTGFLPSSSQNPLRMPPKLVLYGKKRIANASVLQTTSFQLDLGVRMRTESTHKVQGTVNSIDWSVKKGVSSREVLRAMRENTGGSK